MKTKTAWKVTVADTRGAYSEDFIVTAGIAGTAAIRAIKLAQKEEHGTWVGVPYVQEVTRKGTVYVYD